MKAKTFTISFFIQNNLPLNEKQVKLIASKVKLEMEQMEIYREKQKAKENDLSLEYRMSFVEYKKLYRKNKV